jgi:hypothetical protein
MEDRIPAVQYFALVLDDGDPENANGLVRRTHTKPRATDEAIGSDLEWHPTEYLKRYYILGTTDREHVEVSEDFAAALLHRWRDELQEAEAERGEPGTAARAWRRAAE